jgi:tellurite resistance protein
MRGFPVVPASFFGIVLGIAGLGTGWRVAATIWPVSPWIGEVVLAGATILWGVIAFFYAGKWLFARNDAWKEFDHPVQCCFVGLTGVATLLIAVAVLPYSSTASWILAVCGGVIQIGFALYRTGSLLQGSRDTRDNTPILYLPLVAGNFVAAIALGALGQSSWGVLFFGGGLLAWLALESVILHRLYTAEPVALPFRPSLGIQLAPPAVGAVAWLGVNGGSLDLFAQVLVGYAILQLLIAVRLLPWIFKQPFATSYWSFGFGVTALPLATLILTKRGVGGAVAHLAIPLFVLANLVIATLIVWTLYLALRGKLLSHPVEPVPVSRPATAT